MAGPNPRPTPSGPQPRPRPPGRRPGRGARAQTRGPAAPAGTAAASPAPRRAWLGVPAPLRWLGAILTLLVAAVAIFVSLFQWNWLRGPIDDYATARLNRQVTIHGDLYGDIWNWTPSLTAHDVTVAQPRWAGAGQMASLPRLTLAVDLKALLGGKLVLSVVDATRPSVAMIRDAGGRNNWSFGAAPALDAPLKLPPIRHFTIQDGRLTLNDARRRLTFAGAISSNEAINGFGRGRFTLSGQGRLNGAPFLARIEGGPLINVDPDKPYPFQSDVRAGDTHIVARGTIPRPFDLSVFAVDGQITGVDMADLYDLTGITLPNSPPYALRGHLQRTVGRYDVTGIGGRIGTTDVAGHVTVQRQGGGRRILTGELSSRRLNLADLTAIIGGAPRAVIKGTVASPKQLAAAAKLSAEGRIFPDARLDVARVRQMDADVRYRAESVAAGPLPIRRMILRARLDHGVLTLDPLSLVLPQGSVSGHLRLDARGAIPLTSIDLALAGAQVQELLPNRAGQPGMEGALEARARLTGAGDSVRAAAAGANGVVAIAVPHGQMRQLFAELMGLDVGRSLFLYLSHDQTPTPVRCAVAEFHASDGVLTAQRILIDTAAVQATGKGVIDLRDETLNLTLNGRPKHFRLIRIAAPITLTGRLDNPKFGIDVGKALPQAGLAAVLGIVAAPAAAILPFIATGGAPKDADCGALLAEAATHGAPVSRAMAVQVKH